MEETAQPARTTMRRLGGAAVLAIPLLALAVLALTTMTPDGRERRPLAAAALLLVAAAVPLLAWRRARARAAGGPPAPGPAAAPPSPALGPAALPPPPALPAPAPPEAGPGLADLARRSQELADRQRELLDQVGRDQADPRLAGRLLQVDRLAVRARRLAHNLIVLAGGEPARRWDGPATLAEVATVAVHDNPDAARVDLAVADDLLVPLAAADDLANLLAELVDNATAFSAPETRVRIGGQRLGSGYVLEVTDRGLGMTDGELDLVNRRLAGDPAAGDDPEQRLGAWVAGRLAGRHDIRVQLRRSANGGVTALVALPERLVVAPRPYGFRVPDADPPLPRRAPHTSLAPDLAAAADPAGQATPPAARSPEQVRSMLTRYRSGLERGRAAAARDLPDDPDDDLPS
jgi:signal transduction histidine kinase